MVINPVLAENQLAAIAFRVGGCLVVSDLWSVEAALHLTPSISYFS